MPKLDKKAQVNNLVTVDCPCCKYTWSKYVVLHTEWGLVGLYLEQKDNMTDKVDNDSKKQLCPLCNGKLRTARVKKKINGKLVNTGSKAQYCEMYNCDYEKILYGA